MRPTGRILFYQSNLIFDCHNVFLKNNVKQKIKASPESFFKRFQGEKKQKLL